MFVGKGKNRYLAYNIPAAFDIETNNHHPYAWLVCWQLGVAGASFIGRTWEELREAVGVLVEELALDEENRLILYVHNLSFEWAFMKHQLAFTDGFAGDIRSPYKVWTYDGLEFRDSLKLSGLSLDMTMKVKVPNSKVHKLCGSWDYDKQRHSRTILTDDEIKYACYDVLCVMEYIQTLMEQGDGHISSIPLTRTGYVRNDVKKHCNKEKEFQKLIKRLNLQPDEYIRLRQCYMGGFTHASHNYVSFIQETGEEKNIVLKNVGSFDFTSSYPACMVMCKFPMGLAIEDAKVVDQEQFEYYLNEYWCVMEVGFNRLTPKIDYEHILSYSKCIEFEPWHDEHGNEYKGMDNGRVVKCDYARVLITGDDFENFKDFYYWDSMDIYRMDCYYKDYLPTPLVDRILYYYEQKTTLKGQSSADGSVEATYNLLKECCNGIYGMEVEVPVHQAYFLEDGNFYEDGDIEDPETLGPLLTKANEKWGRTTYYPWGVAVTSAARRNLLRGIKACGTNYVYSDTDSIKFLLDKSDDFLNYVEDYNEEVKQKMEAAMKHHGFDIDRWNPTDIKGKHHPLGYWDREHDMDEFKTLGAKRYFYKIGDEYTSTIAGSNKKKTAEYLSKQSDPFASFCIGLVIPPEASGRLVATYFDEPIDGIATDHNGLQAPFNELSGVCLTASAFNMMMSDLFIMYLRTEKHVDFCG